MAAGLVQEFSGFIAKNATVLGNIAMEEEVSIWFGAVIRADRDRIRIGKRSNIQDNAVLHTSIGYPVEIGDDVSVGHGAILHGCRIADRVLVGMGAIVLNGADIGSDSILGAGTVVMEGSRIPSGSVVVGVPGKVIKKVSDQQRNHIVENARNYWTLARGHLHE
jgi:carbonic anhydrase/acetyltransferase-like protein (isoleucine patch superfamily)